MKFIADSFYIYAEHNTGIYAAELFSEEWKLRTGFLPKMAENVEKANLIFNFNNDLNDKDFFIIDEINSTLRITAKTIRGLIFGYSYFLRKITFKNGEIKLCEDICGFHIPQKKIRGHQIGYRTTPNTYDAWDYNQYARCQLDLMAFGANTIEHNGTKGKGEFRNCLMKYEQNEFLAEASHLAQMVDMDVSIWHANDDNETEVEALEDRDKLYSSMVRLDYCFIPGGDPGSLQADEFLKRCALISKVYKKHHPKGQMHISAQAPHKYKNWGEIFVNGLAEKPEEFDMVIMGPNHAYPMHELRRKIPEKYPMRFYPDITHNLRCEYPVNFQQDDWHYAFCNTLSRESVNPRPTEMRTLNRIFSPYTVGSVSYSEGVHDDLNKAVWSALEWDKDSDLREIILDYARFFIWGADEEEITDIIFLLEKNWQGDPVENPCIDVAFQKLCTLYKNHPHLHENWRFMLLYFRGCCDMLVKKRRCFEKALCKVALKYVEKGKYSLATDSLKAPFDSSYNDLRRTIDTTAEKLFSLVGIQLDVEHYHTDGWERGATLDTIDNNVSDRAFLLSKLEKIAQLSKKEATALSQQLLNRNKTDSDEIYYSVALHGLNTLGVSQDGEFYMDIQGDRPDANENCLPMSMTKIYDHYSFKARFGGFKPETDYILTVVYRDRIDEDIKHHKITVNDTVVYDGPQFGGEGNAEFDEINLAQGFRSASYTISRDLIINGTIDLCISEDTSGVNICELWIKKRKGTTY